MIRTERNNKTSLICSAMLIAAAGSSASGQTAFQWDYGDGLWTDTGAWSPVGSPGAFSAADTATVAVPGSYTIDYIASRTIGGLAITNPDAVVDIREGGQLAILGSGLSGSGTLVVSGVPAFPLARAFFDDGISIGTRIILNDQTGSVGNVQLLGPAGAGQNAIIEPGVTISGVGSIDNRFLNHGTVSAGNPGEVISLLATSSGSGPFAQGATGLIFADNGGEIRFNGAMIDGGTIDGTATGLFTSFNNFVTNATFAGDVRIGAGSRFGIGPGNSYTGEITLIGDDLVGQGWISIVDGASLGGFVTLDGQSGNTSQCLLLASGTAGASVTIESDSTISGTGQMAGRYLHNGLIVADGPNEEIFYNNGQGLNWLLPGSTGRLLTDNGGIISLRDSIVEGGTIEGTASGLFTSFNNFVTNATFAGDVRIGAGSRFGIGPGNSYTGELTLIGDDLVGQGWIAVADDAGVGGVITLDGQSGNTGQCLLLANTTAPPAIIEVGATLRGTGTVSGLYTPVSALVAPGTPLSPGNIANNMTGTFELTGDAELDVDVFGLIDFDRLSGGTTSVAGLLTVRLVDGYVPNFNDRFTIVSGSVTGAFDEVDLPFIGDSLFRIASDAPGVVQLIWTCFSDVDPNGTLNIDDIDGFVTAFLSGDLPNADCDHNGTLNIDDIDCFVAGFLAGCP